MLFNFRAFFFWRETKLRNQLLDWPITDWQNGNSVEIPDNYDTKDDPMGPHYAWNRTFCFHFRFLALPCQ